MKKISRLHHIFFALLFVAGLLVQTVPVGANSYFGGNGRITFYSPLNLDNIGQEVYTINPDGTGLAQVTDNVLSDANPQWAPSGTKVAFDHYVDGTNQQDLYTQSVAADGSGSGPATVISGANTAAREFDPSWSPDSETIAYHRCNLDGNDDCDSPYQVYLISPTAGATSRVRVTVDELYADTEPTWRKDGAYLVYTHRLPDDLTNDCEDVDPGPSDDGCDDIYNIAIATPTAGASPTIIDTAVAGQRVGSPQWSPTENKVVYTKNGEFWIYNQDTDTKDVLTSTGGTVSAPTWSPDGRYIATGGAGQIRYFSATTGTLVHTTVVSSGGSTDLVPSEGLIEVDWARADAPPNTVHECTTYVNETCTDFTPEIPAECQSISSAAAHGTPSYADGAHIFTPTQDYVGTDTYVYTYEDESLNEISCTVNITVLPRPPDAGTDKTGFNPVYILAFVAVGSTGFMLRRRVKSRR